MPVVVEMSVSENLDTEDEDIPDKASVQHWAEQACQCEDPVVTSVQVVSNDEMRELNKTCAARTGRPTCSRFRCNHPKKST